MTKLISMLSYQEAKQYIAEIDEKVNHYSKILNSFPKQPNGIVLEKFRNTPEYKEADVMYSKYFKQLQNANSIFVKTFKKEYAEERRLKRLSKVK